MLECSVRLLQKDVATTAHVYLLNAKFLNSFNLSYITSYIRNNNKIIKYITGITALFKGTNTYLIFFTVDDEDLPDLSLEAITMDDVKTSLARTKPAQNDDQKYIDWHNKFGSS